MKSSSEKVQTTDPWPPEMFLAAVEMTHWGKFAAAVAQARADRWKAVRDAEADRLATSVLDMSPEGWLREWHRRGRQNNSPLQAWEWAYQRADLIEAAQRRGYVHIGSDVRCSITVTETGEALLKGTPT